MTEREKMLAGLLYNPADAELAEQRARAHRLSRLYARVADDEPSVQTAGLRELLGVTGEVPYIEAPLFLDYGINTHFGKNCYVNCNFVCVDVCDVNIGDHVMFGPNVTLAPPMHPLVADERRYMESAKGGYEGYEYGRPITIGRDVWLASNVVVCGGVTIGEECVIGAGSVVTRDIPAHSLAVGNPCRAIREITDADRMFPPGLR